ncbi:hypothetical protein [Brevundimonas sp.]|jgi:hypothetical protein|uniref:hypothetical protein n=1 Tax=Brevundimonas sp. TaxID=1871086 RepID=UPI002E10733F|nr:hypothetical protein [Brevundimonas sp.]
MSDARIDTARTAIGQAKALLTEVSAPDKAAPLKALGASALAAVGAVLMAGAFILGPGATFGP